MSRAAVLLYVVYANWKRIVGTDRIATFFEDNLRHASLLEGMRDLTENNAMTGVAIETTVGRRMDVNALIEEEASRGDGSLAVVVSGPPGMADEVRLAVVRVAARACEVEFIEESYSW